MAVPALLVPEWSFVLLRLLVSRRRAAVAPDQSDDHDGSHHRSKDSEDHNPIGSRWFRTSYKGVEE